MDGVWLQLQQEEAARQAVDKQLKAKEQEIAALVGPRVQSAYGPCCSPGPL